MILAVLPTLVILVWIEYGFNICIRKELSAAEHELDLELHNMRKSHVRYVIKVVYKMLNVEIKL